MEKKFDLNNIDKEIVMIDNKIKELEEKLLKDKTLEFQESLKKDWEKIRNEENKKLLEVRNQFKSKHDEWLKKQEKLISIEEIEIGLNNMLDEMEEKWETTLNSAIEKLCEGKTEEEKKEIRELFNNN